MCAYLCIVTRNIHQLQPHTDDGGIGCHAYRKDTAAAAAAAVSWFFCCLPKLAVLVQVLLSAAAHQTAQGYTNAAALHKLWSLIVKASLPWQQQLRCSKPNREQDQQRMV
jgi:hypothetical protein